jgi:hypothetical protein
MSDFRDVLDDILGTAEQVASGSVDIFGAIEAIAEAAKVPPEVKIANAAARSAKRRLGQLKRDARALAAKLRRVTRAEARIDGQADTPREVVLAARITGWRAEIAVLQAEIARAQAA